MKLFRFQGALKRTLTSAADEALKIQLKEKLKIAMRAKEKVQVSVIKGVLADIINAEKSGQTVLPSVSFIIQKSIKMRNDSIAQYKEGGREDLASAEALEKTILETFLPKQLDHSEIESIVKRVVIDQKLGDAGVKDLGKLMKVLNTMPELDISIVPKQLLSELSKTILQQWNKIK